jgi:hypothetical protein
VTSPGTSSMKSVQRTLFGNSAWQEAQRNVGCNERMREEVCAVLHCCRNLTPFSDISGDRPSLKEYSEQVNQGRAAHFPSKERLRSFLLPTVVKYFIEIGKMRIAGAPLVLTVDGWFSKFPTWNQSSGW